MKFIRVGGEVPFKLVMLSGVQFLLLTFTAMVVYAGGSRFNTNTNGYSFFHNFFSELGFTMTRSGNSNLLSAGLFWVALTVAGLGLIVFFLVSLQFFWENPWQRGLSLFGTAAGLLSGIGYIGIAFTPANLFPAPHLQFVLLAFRAFLPAVLFYLVVILLNHRYPNRYAGVYLIFAVLLAAYIVLLTRGPSLETAQGVMIQATGQKIIVYAAIIVIFIQSWGAIQVLRQRESVTEN